MTAGSLRARTAHGAVLMIASNVLVRALGLIGTLVLTHYIEPDEFGQVGAALIWLLTANQLSTLGTGTYIVAQSGRSRDGLFEATVLHLALGAVAIAAVVACAEPMSRGTHFQGASGFVPLLAASVVLDRVRFLPERILVRDMRFGIVSALRSGGELTYVAVTLAGAMLGFGAMSIRDETTNCSRLARGVIRTSLYEPSTASR